MLIRLGQKVIQGNQCDEWLSMVQVAGLCRKYRLKWQGGSTKAIKLEQTAKDYLDKHGDIKGGGVAVEYNTDFNEDKRRDELYPEVPQAVWRRTLPLSSTNQYEHDRHQRNG